MTWVNPPETSSVLMPCFLRCRQQRFRAGREFQPLIVNAPQRAFIEAFEQRHAALQAFVVFDLAAHRLFGDGRDLRLQADQIGQFVDGLDGDQRRIHVHHQQLEIRQPPRFGHKREIELRALAKRRDFRCRIGIAQTKRGNAIICSMPDAPLTLASALRSPVSICAP